MEENIREYMSMLAKRSAASLTPEQRVERAKKAVQARWQKNGIIKDNGTKQRKK